MQLEEITELKNTKSNYDNLHFPGNFIYGSAVLMKDKLNLSDMISGTGWDCFSAVGTIIQEQQIEPLKKEFNSYLIEYMKKKFENQQEEEDCTSLLIFEINGSYYAFILYCYEPDYAVSAFESIGYEEDQLLTIGGDNNDYDLIETLVYEIFDEDFETFSTPEQRETVVFFRDLILPWIKNTKGWEDDYKVLTQGFDE
ncbi:MAG: hypothetical protein [Caudoviricetes sp.]|nr:MAG: hypothetical protein [Caudoviricetes sp.]